MPYRIGEACARTGLTPKQLRDWERRGIARTRRGPGNQRTYDESELERLRRAKRMRDVGLALAEIRYALAILDGTAVGGEAKAIAQVRLVLGRIRAQLDLADELSDAIRARLLQAVRTGGR